MSDLIKKAQDTLNDAMDRGFDWPSPKPVFEKLNEEIGELITEVNTQNKDRVIDEMGDVLFTAINLALVLDVDPGDALNHATEKFNRRFELIKNKKLKELTLEQLQTLWQQAKKEIDNG